MESKFAGFMTDAGMGTWERNQSLYFHLKNLGLHVKAVLRSDDKGEGPEIDQIIVSVAPPQVPLVVPSDSGYVSAPVEGTEIGEVVGTAAGFGDNVVDLPTNG